MSLILDGTLGLSDVDGTAATPAIRGTDSNTGVFFATDIVGLATGGTERMRIDSSGNVGIGTSSPATKAEISGSAAASNLALRITNTATDGYSTLQMGDGNAGVYRNGSAQSGYAGASSLNLITVGAHNIGFSTGNTLRAIIDSSGNVGIGTSSPSSTLHVSASAASARIASTGANGSYLRFYSNNQTTAPFEIGQGLNTGTDNVGYVWNLASAAMSFGTSSAERMRITSGGDLLVGTTALAGTVSNGRSIVVGGIRSLNGEFTSLASGTAYTMFTAPADFCTYLVNVHGGVSAVSYSETAIVQVNNGSIRVDIISAGTNVVIDNSGTDIRVTQNGGVSMGFLVWSAMRMA
jgi:hypothetical protein